jgi:hypothetical protein
MGVLNLQNRPVFTRRSVEARHQRGARQAKRQQEKHCRSSCDSRNGPEMFENSQGILAHHCDNHHHQQHDHENVNEFGAADPADLDFADTGLAQQVLSLNAQ